MDTYSSMGEAEGAAMAHNARMAADLARLTTVRAETTPEPSAMSVPLSDTRLAEIRERAAGLYESSLPENLPAEAVALAGEDVPDLLAEVDRLRAVVEDHGREAVQYEADYDRLRADLERIQRWATTTVHGSAAAEVLLLIRNLPATPTI